MTNSSFLNVGIGHKLTVTDRKTGSSRVYTITNCTIERRQRQATLSLSALDSQVWELSRIGVFYYGRPSFTFKRAYAEPIITDSVGLQEIIEIVTRRAVDEYSYSLNLGTIDDTRMLDISLSDTNVWAALKQIATRWSTAERLYYFTVNSSKVISLDHIDLTQSADYELELFESLTQTLSDSPDSFYNVIIPIGSSASTDLAVLVVDQVQADPENRHGIWLLPVSNQWMFDIGSSILIISHKLEGATVEAAGQDWIRLSTAVSEVKTTSVYIRVVSGPLSGFSAFGTYYDDTSSGSDRALIKLKSSLPDTNLTDAIIGEQVDVLFCVNAGLVAGSDVRVADAWYQARSTENEKMRGNIQLNLQQFSQDSSSPDTDSFGFVGGMMFILSPSSTFPYAPMNSRVILRDEIYSSDYIITGTSTVNDESAGSNVIVEVNNTKGFESGDLISISDGANSEYTIAKAIDHTNNTITMDLVNSYTSGASVWLVARGVVNLYVDRSFQLSEGIDVRGTKVILFQRNVQGWEIDTSRYDLSCPETGYLDITPKDGYEFPFGLPNYDISDFSHMLYGATLVVTEGDYEGWSTSINAMTYTASSKTLRLTVPLYTSDMIASCILYFFAPLSSDGYGRIAFEPMKREEIEIGNLIPASGQYIAISPGIASEIPLTLGRAVKKVIDGTVYDVAGLVEKGTKHRIYLSADVTNPYFQAGDLIFVSAAHPRDYETRLDRIRHRFYSRGQVQRIKSVGTDGSYTYLEIEGEFDPIPWKGDYVEKISLQNTESISRYGRREKIVSMTDVSDTFNLWREAQRLLNIHSEPAKSYSFNLKDLAKIDWDLANSLSAIQPAEIVTFEDSDLGISDKVVVTSVTRDELNPWDVSIQAETVSSIFSKFKTDPFKYIKHVERLVDFLKPPVQLVSKEKTIAPRSKPAREEIELEIGWSWSKTYYVTFTAMSEPPWSADDGVNENIFQATDPATGQIVYGDLIYSEIDNTVIPDLGVIQDRDEDIQILNLEVSYSSASTTYMPSEDELNAIKVVVLSRAKRNPLSNETYYEPVTDIWVSDKNGNSTRMTNNQCTGCIVCVTLPNTGTESPRPLYRISFGIRFRIPHQIIVK